jgi:hypothetical protein
LLAGVLFLVLGMTVPSVASTRTESQEYVPFFVVGGDVRCTTWDATGTCFQVMGKEKTVQVSIIDDMSSVVVGHVSFGSTRYRYTLFPHIPFCGTITLRIPAGISSVWVFPFHGPSECLGAGQATTGTIEATFK